MVFGVYSLLFGLVVIAVPLALHLFAKRTPVRVVLPSFLFITEATAKESSLARIRELWLLALRILILAVLVLALAQPLLSSRYIHLFVFVSVLWLCSFLCGLGSSLLDGKNSSPRSHRFLLVLALASAFLASILVLILAIQGVSSSPIKSSSPAATIIVVDNSIRSYRKLFERTASIEGRGQDLPINVISRIRSDAKRILDQCPQGSEVAIIDRVFGPVDFTKDLYKVHERIEQIRPVAYGATLGSLFDSAVSLLQSRVASSKRLVLMTDLSRGSFPDSEWSDARMRKSLASNPEIAIDIYDCCEKGLTNFKLGSLSFPDAPSIATNASPMIFSVHRDGIIAVNSDDDRMQGNASDPIFRRESITVDLEIYESREAKLRGLPVVRNSKIEFPSLLKVDRASVDIGVGDKASAGVLTLPPLQHGLHHGKVVILKQDDFDFDNVKYFTIDVTPPKSLLLVGSNRRSAEVIAQVLTAPVGLGDPRSRYRIDIQENLGVRQRNYDDYSAILLIDPPPVSHPDEETLRDYLNGGGKVVYFLGANFEETSRGHDPESSLIPSLPARRWRIPAPGTFLELSSPSHQAISELTRQSQVIPWSKYRVFQYLEVNTTDRLDEEILRYAGTNHAAVFVRTGNQLVFTTPIPAFGDESTKWNNLFANSDPWPVFAMIRELFGWLLSKDSAVFNYSTNDFASSPIFQPLSRDRSADVRHPIRLQSTSATASDNDAIIVYPPIGQAFPLGKPFNEIALHGDHIWPGTYWIRGNRLLSGLSLNPTNSDLDLGTISANQLDEWLGVGRYKLIKNRDGSAGAKDSVSHYYSLYDWLMVLLVCFYIQERFVANRSSKSF